MKKTIISLVMLFFVALRAEILPTLGLGEEKVKPLLYPKFTMSGDYAGDARIKSLQNSSIQKKVKGQFDAGLGIEVGVLKYLNAGFDLTFRNGVLKGANLSPLALRFPLFLKPYIPFTDRIGIFIKGQAGPSLALAAPTSELLFLGEENNKAVAETYHFGHYAPMSYGLTTSAAAGIDVFPWSRIGFSLQWGIRYDIYRANVEKHDKPAQAPSGINFSMMDFPATFTLQLIL